MELNEKRIKELDRLSRKFSKLAEYYYEDRDNVKEYEQKCIEAFSKADCTTEELHYLAENHNFDDGTFSLESIISSSNCDILTARMIYWLSAPEYYYDEFGGAEFCDEPYNQDFADLIVKMEEKARNEGYIDSKKIVLSDEMAKFISRLQLDYSKEPYNKIPECFR